jgi:hypothetical protein
MLCVLCLISLGSSLYLQQILGTTWRKPSGSSFWVIRAFHLFLVPKAILFMTL